MATGGGGQSLARVLAAIEGFAVKHGEWPSIVRVHFEYLEHLRNDILTADEFAQLSKKIVLIPGDDAIVVAENEAGLTYNYGKSGFSKLKPSISARAWLGLNTSNSSLDTDAQARRST